MTHKSDAAIEVLQKGLDPAMNHTFPQADTMVLIYVLTISTALIPILACV